MASPDDNALLREFADQQSETAFAELVQRHLNLVYSAAMRYTGNPSDAQDIAQAVFLILARKARNLRQRTTLTGWLYETTRLTASQLCRTRRRQQIRDQEAYMQSTLDQAGIHDVWRQIAPHLEDAMSRLNESDRALLALRFYENKTGTEAARLLGIEAEAAHKRTARALEKLRSFFAKRGVNSTPEIITGAISANSIQAAPAGLAATISYAALSAKTTATAFVAAKTMTILQKIFATTTTIAAVGATIYAFHVQNQFRALQQQNASLLAQIQQLQQQLGDATNQIAALTGENVSLQQNSDELLRLRAEVTRLHQIRNAPATNVPTAIHTSSIGIYLKAAFYFIPDDDLQNMGIAWTSSPQGGQIGYLDAPQLNNIASALNGASDVTVLSLPRLECLNGQRAVMSVTRQYFLQDPASTNLIVSDTHELNVTNFGNYTNTGEIFDTKASCSSDSSTFDLNFNFELRDLTGDPSAPTVQTIQITNDVNFAAGKTLALEQPVPPGSWMPDETNLLNTPKDLMILITPQAIDPNNFHPGRQ